MVVAEWSKASYLYSPSHHGFNSCHWQNFLTFYLFHYFHFTLFHLNSFFQKMSSTQFYKCTNKYCTNTYLDEEIRDWHSNRCRICPHCGIKNSRLDNLKRHVITCKSRMDLNEFKCDQCTKTFAHKTSMYRHKRSVHK